MDDDEQRHPLRRGHRRRLNRNLSRDDIANQARCLLTNFIRERMESDGFQDIPAVEALQEPGTPSGPPVEQVREVARALRCIGDELDGDERLQRLIQQIPPDATHQSFLNVATEIFKDGIFNWGRIVALFYFAYKMVVKAIQQALNQVPIMRSVVEWVVHFIMDYVAPWIIERGGWEAIQEYFGTPSFQAAAVLLSGVLLSVLFVYLKSR